MPVISSNSAQFSWKLVCNEIFGGLNSSCEASWGVFLDLLLLIGTWTLLNVHCPIRKENPTKTVNLNFLYFPVILDASSDCHIVNVNVGNNQATTSTRSWAITVSQNLLPQIQNVGRLDWARPFPADAAMTSRANEGLALSALPWPMAPRADSA